MSYFNGKTEKIKNKTTFNMAATKKSVFGTTSYTKEALQAMSEFSITDHEKPRLGHIAPGHFAYQLF